MTPTDWADPDEHEPNPYAAPRSPRRLAPAAAQGPPGSIAVFAVINFILGGIGGLGVVLMICMIVYGAAFSGDRGEELAAGILGSILLMLPCLVGLLVYLAAGIGLVSRRPYGYYCHLAGAVLAALTCVGLPYTILALVFALQPAFSGAFFPAAGRAVPLDRADAW